MLKFECYFELVECYCLVSSGTLTLFFEKRKPITSYFQIVFCSLRRETTSYFQRVVFGSVLLLSGLIEDRIIQGLKFKKVVIFRFPS